MSSNFENDLQRLEALADDCDTSWDVVEAELARLIDRCREPDAQRRLTEAAPLLQARRRGCSEPDEQVGAPGNPADITLRVQKAELDRHTYRQLAENIQTAFQNQRFGEVLALLDKFAAPAAQEYSATMLIPLDDPFTRARLTTAAQMRAAAQEKLDEIDMLCDWLGQLIAKDALLSYLRGESHTNITFTIKVLTMQTAEPRLNNFLAAARYLDAYQVIENTLGDPAAPNRPDGMLTLSKALALLGEFHFNVHEEMLHSGLAQAICRWAKAIYENLSAQRRQVEALREEVQVREQRFNQARQDFMDAFDALTSRRSRLPFRNKERDQQVAKLRDAYDLIKNGSGQMQAALAPNYQELDSRYAAYVSDIERLSRK